MVVKNNEPQLTCMLVADTIPPLLSGKARLNQCISMSNIFKYILKKNNIDSKHDKLRSLKATACKRVQTCRMLRTKQGRRAITKLKELKMERSIVNLLEAGQLSENQLPCLRHLIPNEAAGAQRKDQRPDANLMRHDHVKIFESVIQQLVRLLIRAVCGNMQKQIVSERQCCGRICLSELCYVRGVIVQHLCFKSVRESDTLAPWSVSMWQLL